MSNPAALDALARILGDAMSPLAERLQGDQAEETMAQLGLRLPLNASGVTQGLQASATACSQLPAAVTAVIDAAGGGDDGALISAVVNLGELIIRAGSAFVQLGSALDAVVQGDSSLSAAQKNRLNDVVQKLPDRLLHLALISYVEEKQPAVKGALELTGLFDDIRIEADPADPSLAAHRLKQVRFDRIAPLFSNPAEHLKTLYGFGDASFDGAELFRRIKQMIDRPEAEVLIIDSPGQPLVLEAWLFRIEVVPGATPALRLRLRIPAEKDLNVSTPLAGPWSATVTSSARFEGGIELLLHPTQGLHIEPPVAAASIDLAFGIKAENSDSSPMILVGQAGGSRLELQRFALRLPLKLSASTGAASPNFSFGAALELNQGKVVIDGSQADGFLATLIGDLNVESAFDLGASYDTADGLRFNGSATIEIAIPTHLSLGPIEIQQIYLIGGFDDGAIPIEFSVDLGAALGPLQVSVSRMGANAKISFPEGGGNAGVAQIDLAFKPPSGVGLAVDAGAVKGGGYLFFDFDREEYAGAVELVLVEWIAVKAIGLITTRMPDGTQGFSLLIIITVEFGTGIQLGFGFTLNAVGGILGLNRIVNVEPLKVGIRTGAIESVMFPQDVVANAPKIISDLRAFFPPQQDIFLVGPMAKIGWGTPTLVTVSLGVILEFPSVNITILGVIKVALPDEKVAVLKLQVNFIGRLEPSNKLLWFYAELYDSRVLLITLEGGFGLLVNWGDQANFVISVGGFHPRYNPPPLPFPEPPRILVNILNTPFAKIHVKAYFAVTSNSVQFGARAELYFGLSAFRIEGHLAFDVLFQFNPFFFSFTLSISLSVKVFGIGLFSVGFSGLLEGPTPWHIKGKGSISVLFWSISVPFEHTWGDNNQTKFDPIAVYPLLEAELKALSNWEADVPAGNSLLVSLRKLGDSDADQLVLHPIGKLRVSQRRLPLDFTMQKVGNQKPSDYESLQVQATLPGGETLSVSTVKEKFAIGQFKDLDGSAKLSSPGFEPLNSGMEIGVSGEQTKTSRAVRRVIRYETIIIDNLFKRRVKPFFVFFASGYATLNSFLFTHFLTGGSASQSKLSMHYKKRMQPHDETIAVKPHEYSVALNANNQPFDGGATTFASQAQATQYMHQQIESDPGLANKLHVLPNTEIESMA